MLKQFFRKLWRFIVNIFLFIPRLFSSQRKLNVAVDGLHTAQEKDSFASRLKQIFSDRSKTDSFYTQLEDALIAGDVGVDTTIYFIQSLKEKIGQQDLAKAPLSIHPNKLNVLFVMGVNGVGKTTSIAKLANFYKGEGYNLAIAACDTFRAAAIEQLSE